MTLYCREFSVGRSPLRRINIVYSHHMLRSVGAQCYHNLKQHHNYFIWNYWVFGLCPWCGILKIRKHNVSETGCFRSQVRGKKPTLLSPLERANLNHWTH
jgi:hypothetical protein